MARSLSRPCKTNILKLEFWMTYHCQNWAITCAIFWPSRNLTEKFEPVTVTLKSLQLSAYSLSQINVMQVLYLLCAWDKITFIMRFSCAIPWVSHTWLDISLCTDLPKGSHILENQVTIASGIFHGMSFATIAWLLWISCSHFLKSRLKVE